MARGTEAKENVVAKIKEAFGQDFIGEFSKKIYVYANEGGEKIQVAISLTCPKEPVNVIQENQLNYNEGIDFNNPNTVIVNKPTGEITPAERDTVRQLMKELGL